jgi:hypothetical protein
VTRTEAKLVCIKQEKQQVEVTLRLTVSRSVCLGIEHPRGTCNQILLSVGMLLSVICGLVSWAPFLTRERVCNLQCNHSIVRVTQNPKPYFTVSSETPATWRARFPYLYPPGTGWPSYTPGHWVPFTSSLMTRCFKNNKVYEANTTQTTSES